MKNEIENEPPVSTSENTEKTDRRSFLGNLGKAGLTAAAVSTILPFVEPRSGVFAQRGNGNSTVNSFYHQRAQAAYQFRINCAKDNFQPVPPLFNRPNNGDEELYPN